MMRRLATALASLVAVSVLAVAVGFTVFTAAVDEKPGAMPSVDGIVALTGGAERVETALRLLDTGKAKMLLVSGVAHGAHLHDLASRVGLSWRPGLPLAAPPRRRWATPKKRRTGRGTMTSTP